MIHLVLGGARSGKSNYAQQLAIDTGLPIVYIATATELDDEMTTRIAHHKKNRPKDWRVREAPLNLIETIENENKNEQTILVDCLTLWLNNQLFHHPDQDFSVLFNRLHAVCDKSKSTIIFVANEVGLGIIPLGEISRKFVDEAGRLNQVLAQLANKVTFVAAGLPLNLKDS
jgi:adenosylcobinamide kinase/adenosylcobinamide-phosphate guanylyltransferase